MVMWAIFALLLVCLVLAVVYVILSRKTINHYKSRVSSLEPAIESLRHEKNSAINRAEEAEKKAREYEDRMCGASGGGGFPLRNDNKTPKPGKGKTKKTAST